MTKWEYCLVRQHSGDECWLYKSDGEKEKIKGPNVSLASVLARLGTEGWEAVNYTYNRKEVGWGDVSFNVWPVSVGDREFLFKRSAD
jgi:hypothetical protein